MQGKIMFALGAAIGYVVGTRSGREAYDKLKTQANDFWQDPRVQQKVHEAQDFAKDKLPIVGEKATQAAKKGREKMSKGTESSDSGTSGSDSTGTTTTTTTDMTPEMTEPTLATPTGEGATGNVQQ